MMKVWLITGCSSGFGKALAKHALAQGDAVIATARKPEALEDLQGDVLKLALDVTKDISKTIEEAVAWKGKIDVLVNNAGFGNIGSIEETAPETWQKVFDVNVFGLVNVTREVLPHMRKARSGHVLNISSVAGLITMPGFGTYCATKHAVEGISDALAQEVAPLGIKVTAIEPGAFRTKFVGNVIEDATSDDYKQTVAPVKEMMESLETNAGGDPEKAAKVMFDVAHMQEPPARLLLGSDAFAWATQKMDALKAEMVKNEKISTSTDFS